MLTVHRGTGGNGASDADAAVALADDVSTFQFGWRAVALNLVFWTMLAILTTTNRLLDPFRPAGRPRAGAQEIGYWFYDSYVWALVTPFIFWLAWRLGGGRRHWLTSATGLALVGVVLAVAMGVVNQAVARELFGFGRFGRFGGGADATWLRMVFAPGFLSDFVTYTGIVAAGFAWDYFRRYRARREEAVRLQAQAAHLQAQLAEARLAVLRNQLNPHFLFNTLNAVSALVARDPKGVRRMIARLSELLRYSLSEQEQEVMVDEELKMLGQYLQILEIRYQGRLETTLHADPGLGDALVPSFILQPLAENAMTHGVGKAGGHGRIEVRVSRSGDRLVLSVTDTGPGDGVVDAHELAPGGAGSGTGLRNTRARLAELYGDDQSLALRPTPEGGMTAEIVIPLRRSTSARPVYRLGARLTMADSRALRVLIVDDEPLGIERLRELVEEQPNVEVVGTADDGVAAIQAIRTLHPDLVFLDIQMPRKTGIDVVRDVGPEAMPATIFVTAYDQYALQAFDFAAIDYLVKPYDDERFEEAFRRARRKIELEGLDRLRDQLLTLLQGGAVPAGASPPAPPQPSTAPAGGYLDRIAVQMKGKMRVVPVSQIEYITASGPYAELHVGPERHIIRESMQNLEEQLDPGRFMRIHRSAIVRIDLVDSLLRGGAGDYEVQLKSGVRLRVGRSRREVLEKRLGKTS